MCSFCPKKKKNLSKSNSQNETRAENGKTGREMIREAGGLGACDKEAEKEFNEYPGAYLSSIGDLRIILRI